MGNMMMDCSSTSVQTPTTTNIKLLFLSRWWPKSIAAAATFHGSHQNCTAERVQRWQRASAIHKQRIHIPFRICSRLEDIQHKCRLYTRAREKESASLTQDIPQCWPMHNMQLLSPFLSLYLSRATFGTLRLHWNNSFGCGSAVGIWATMTSFDKFSSPWWVVGSV